MSKPVRPAVRRTSLANPKQVEQELRDKVKELESEVKSLKTKLDELRKAKNTTLIKKEKEFVSTGVPQRQSNVDPSSNVNKEELERSLKAKYQKQIDELNKEISELKLNAQKQPKPSPPSTAPVDCGHEEVIYALQNRLSETESVNTALTIECHQLQDKLTQSYEEISKREAEHCEAQEKMKIELQKKWQEMYKEWMRTTEAKIIELQAANDMLKRMLGNPPP